jgi:hypothetical protein
MQKGEPAYCLGKVELDKRLDITLTRDLLGYAPQDDAFNIFGDHLREWLQD